jgi:alpha-beta hydrolase superfamily lysophospholipase
VVYLAPMFGHYRAPNVVESFVNALMASLFDEVVFMTYSVPLNLLTRNVQFLQQYLVQYKSVPILTAMQLDSTRVNAQRACNEAGEVGYAHLTVLAEKDVVVSNEAAAKWHEQSGSALKQLCVVPSALHLLFKEPSNQNRVFETILNFTQTLPHSTPLGQIDKTQLRTPKY